MGFYNILRIFNSRKSNNFDLGDVYAKIFYGTSVFLMIVTVIFSFACHCLLVWHSLLFLSPFPSPRFSKISAKGRSYVDLRTTGNTTVAVRKNRPNSSMSRAGSNGQLLDTTGKNIPPSNSCVALHVTLLPC